MNNFRLAYLGADVIVNCAVDNQEELGGANITFSDCFDPYQAKRTLDRNSVPLCEATPNALKVTFQTGFAAPHIVEYSVSFFFETEEIAK